jgi:hypothetical protein
MQTSTTVVTSLKRVSADADALMVALESRIQSSAHALAVREESRFFRDDDDDEYEEEEEEEGVEIGIRRESAEEEEEEKKKKTMKKNNNNKNAKREEDDDDVAKTTTRKRDAKKADAHFRKGLEMMRNNEAKNALNEFELAIEFCPLKAIRARETLENARERAMEMTYSGSYGDDGDDNALVDVDERNTNIGGEMEKRMDEGAAAKATATKTTTKITLRREEIEELYDASRWLLRSTPRDGREAVRLLRMAQRMLREDEEEGGAFLDDGIRKEIRIAKEKIERAIKHVKR